ncbi:MAG: carboxymuconolactone decarboxylase family protein [Nitrospinota bacterium]
MAMSPKGKKLLEQMRKARGFVFPAFELLCEMDPGLIERYEALKNHILGKEEGFPEKHKELFITIAIAVRDPSAHEQLKLHLKRALKLGATPVECLEAFEAVLPPSGMSILVAGCNALKEVLDEMKAKA